MSVSANMVYLKPGNWLDAGADVWVHSWGGTQGDVTGVLKPVGLGLYGLDIKNNTQCLFVRQSGGQNGINWNSNWYKTGDLTITSGKECYHVSGWDVKGWIAVPSAYIAGATELTGHDWSANASDNKMTKQNDGTYTLTKTIASITKGEYEYKVTDGSWGWSFGEGSNNKKINIPATGKYEVTFTYTPSPEEVSATATPIYSVTVNAGEGGIASGSTSECVSGNSINISAEALENYEFVNWTIASGTGSFGNASEASTTFQPTSNATIQANFRSTVTYSLTLQGGTGIASVTGNNDNVTLGQSYNISAEIVDGYSFAGWTADVAANADITDASLASTSVVVKNGSVVLTASATEITSTLTTANTYSEGTPDIAAPTASVSKVGVATTATITAASNAAYALTSWTLTNCERTDGGAANATEITIKGLGNDNEASVVANYTKIPEETVYLINTEAWETVMVYHWNPQGAAYPGAEMTKTGETIATFDVYEYTFAGSPQGLVFNCGGDECKTGDLTWEKDKYYAPSTGEWYADAATAEEALAAVVTYDYYVVGTINGWGLKDASYGMELSGDVYEKEVAFVIGKHELKINNGTWDNANTFGYDNVSVAYEGVSRGSGDGDNNIVIDLAEAKTITIKLDKNTKKITLEGLTQIHTVEATVNPAETGSVEGAKTYKHGEQATLTATAAEGYEFVNWTVAGEEVSTEATYSFTVTADVEVVANFKEAEPEYNVVEDEITNLNIDTESMCIIGGPSAEFGVDVFLALTEQNQDGTWALSDESSVAIQGIDATFIDGYAYDIDLYAPAVKVVLRVEFGGSNYELHIDMVSKPVVIEIADAIVSKEEYPDGMGGTYTNWTMDGQWSDGETTYPVLVNMPDFDPTIVEADMTVTITIGSWVEVMYGAAEGSVHATVAENVVTLTGTLTSYAAGTWEVTISGTLPVVEEPETPDPENPDPENPDTPTSVDNVEATVAPVKMIENGQLIIVKNGVKYNAQGAILK